MSDEKARTAEDRSRGVHSQRRSDGEASVPRSFKDRMLKRGVMA